VPTASPRNPLAPDPATITFGSNRPVVAAPPKLPESSGLRFSGPSAGILKASGPQPTSPKASGLTFTAAKANTPTKAGTPAKPAPKTSNAKAPAGEAAKVDAKKPDAKKSDSKPGTAKPAAAKPGTTKPAIAPQASGRMFDKERSPASSLVAVLVALVVIGSGLSFWLKLGNETPPRDSLATAESPAPAMTETPLSGPVASMRAPETPGPLAGDTASGDMAGEAALSTAEIEEIQALLSRLDLDPGSHSGVLTAETTAAIRSYQEMAGLPADGAANKALLDELRTVAELYGG